MNKFVKNPTFSLLSLKSKNIEKIIKNINRAAATKGQKLLSEVLYVANNKAPIAPTDAASVGVAKPDKIESKTDIIKKRGGKRISNIFFLFLEFSSLLIILGIEDGSVNDFTIW